MKKRGADEEKGSCCGGEKIFKKQILRNCQQRWFCDVSAENESGKGFLTGFIIFKLILKLEETSEGITE